LRLFYFTQSYPFGIGEQWKANELNVLVNEFEEIIVVPFSYAGNFNDPKRLPEGVRLTGPLFEKEVSLASPSDLFRILFHPQSPSFLKEFFSKKVYRKKTHIINWITASRRAIDILGHPAIREIIKNGSKKDILYFYWGKGGCEFLPFVDTGVFFKTFVRMHRYDLFEYANNGYIPYRKALLKAASITAPSSMAGKLHLDQLYPQYEPKIQVIRCGTLSEGQFSRPSTDGVLRVVSCSFLSPVKQVHLIIEALQLVEFPIHWVHIGDGILREELEKLVDDLGVGEKFQFKGLMDSRKVLDFYGENNFDLFVNVSSSEGVPFSIMEAFSVGIPVMATNVGGTGEIVDDETGKILPPDIKANDLADALRSFYKTPHEEKQKKRDEALSRYKKYWDSEKLTKELSVLLKK